MIEVGVHLAYATSESLGRESQFMAHNKRPTVRKPATKFAHLRKKMDLAKLRGNVQQVRRTTHK